MANVKQARKWLLVINNPHEAGFTHEVITDKLALFAPTYFCMSDEIADTGTYHTHIYICSSSPIRFTTIKSRFPTAHIENAYGSSLDNREYITKTGKWADTLKAETAVKDSFMEWGKIPTEADEKDENKAKLMKDIISGKTTVDIISDAPNYAFRIREIETLRQALLMEKSITEYRTDLNVVYIYGPTGTGKTRGIYQNHDPRDICRITNYRNGNGIVFDNYNAQNVLVFEEFNSQIPIYNMLNILDIYPITLPARYSDKVACYRQVYITSNIPLEEQYWEVQKTTPEIWHAFLRRIHKVVQYVGFGETIERSVKHNGKKS